jgi:hypothetical protein
MRLLANTVADLAGNRVPPGLAGYEDQIAETGRRRQIGICRRKVDLNNFFSGHAVSCANLPCPNRLADLL